MSEDLSAKFARIRAFYKARHELIMADGCELADDPYAWEHIAGIRLTPIERALWHDIRGEDAVLYPQYPVGRYFVDFGNPVAMVAIECDGAKWHIDAAKDAARQQEIEALGWTVYRISGKDCFTDTEYVEDDQGSRATAGAARVFMREICQRHCITRDRRDSSRKGSWWPA